MLTESSFDWSQPVPRLSGYDFSRKPRWQGHWGGYLSGYNARYFLEYDHPAGTARLWVFCQPIFGTRGWYGEGPASYDPAGPSIRFSVQGIRHDPRSGQPLTILRCTGEAKDMPDHVGLKLNPSEKPLLERRLTNPPPTQTSTPTAAAPPPPPPKPPAPPQAKQPTQPSSKPSPQATVASPPPQASQATQPLQRVWPKPRHFVGQIAGQVPIHLELDRPFGDKVIGYSSSTWEKGEGSFDLIGRITPGGVLNLVAYSGKQPVRKLVGSIQGDKGDRLVADWLELDRNGRVVRSRELVAFYTPAPEPATRQARQDGNGAPDALDELMGIEQFTPRYTVEQIRRARGLIAQEPDAKKRGDLYLLLQSKVSYRNQRNNSSIGREEDEKYTPFGDMRAERVGKPLGDVMCNLTSAAMALEQLGIGNPDPKNFPQFEDYLEHLRRKIADAKVKANPEMEKAIRISYHRESRAGWQSVIEAMGGYVEDVGSGQRDKEWWEKNVLPHLAKGHSIMMSIGGHIVRVQKVSEEGLIVDDPYGLVRLFPGAKWDYGENWQQANSLKNADKSQELAGARGEDVLWKWSDVSKHSMRWIVAVRGK